MKKVILLQRIMILGLCLFLVAAIAGCDPKEPGPLKETGPLNETGPYEVQDQIRTGPNDQYRLMIPQTNGQNDEKFPIIVFPAGGVMVQSYKGLLHQVVSHGFVVIAFMPTLVPDLTTGLNWLIAENEREESTLFGKLDTSRIAAMGQSFGAFMAFQLSADPRIITSVHINGGTAPPHQLMENLHAPSMFICGDDPVKLDGNGMDVGDMAYANCIGDFEAVTTTPVFLALVEQGSHVSVIDKVGGIGCGTDYEDEPRNHFYKAIVGWLRWQLAGEQEFKSMFVGNDCELCGPDTRYVVMQKNLE